MKNPTAAFIAAALIAATLCVSALLSGCATDYQTNRAYLPPFKWIEVETLYKETGSIDIVERELRVRQWFESDIREAVYRLEKKYEIVEEAAKPIPEMPERRE